VLLSGRGRTEASGVVFGASRLVLSAFGTLEAMWPLAAARVAVSLSTVMGVLLASESSAALASIASASSVPTSAQRFLSVSERSSLSISLWALSSSWSLFANIDSISSSEAGFGGEAEKLRDWCLVNFFVGGKWLAGPVSESTLKLEHQEIAGAMINLWEFEKVANSLQSNVNN
jgi:hypothetical protein